MEGVDGRGPDSELLGARQRLGLAAGIELGAPPRRRIGHRRRRRPREPSLVTFLVEPHHDIVRLTVTHENLANLEMLGGISHGWPAVLANLKSLLETGEVLPQAPWEMSPAHT